LADIPAEDGRGRISAAKGRLKSGPDGVGQLDPVADSDFLVDLVDVPLHGVNRYEEGVGNGLISRLWSSAGPLDLRA
jgi:hypothetical protein